MFRLLDTLFCVVLWRDRELALSPLVHSLLNIMGNCVLSLDMILHFNFASF